MDDEQSDKKNANKREWFGFYSLVLIQAQSAFNEKAAQFLLIPLGAWAALHHTAYTHDSWVNSLQYILGAIFVLPYILFSPIVGWLSDCFCKTRIIQVMCLIQIFVLAGMYCCYHFEHIGLAVALFCIFALQATILSPAKKGVVKDMVGSKKLGFASGVIEMTYILSMLVAQVGVFVWFDVLQSKSNDGWDSAAFPTLILTLISIPVAFASLILPKYKVQQHKPFEWNLFYEHFVQLKYLWSHRILRLSETGVSYFWFLAGALTLITIQTAHEHPVDGQQFSMSAAILAMWLSGGTVVGGFIASRICLKKIELGLIPLGATGFTLGCIWMGLFTPGTLPSNIGLAVTGAFAAAYLVPLNAYLQDNSDPAHRSTVIAAGNLMDCLMGLIAVGVQLLLAEVLDIPIQYQFWVLAVLSLGITIIAFRLIPRDFVRMMGLWTMSIVYRTRIIHQNKIPEEGGVIIVSNHVTYADALFLSLISPRPIRFIVAEEFVAVKWLGWILELFNCLPISSRNPRQALSKAIQALKCGEVICIFPEGQLTRTGTLCAAKRGVELLAKKANCPTIPVYMDELWGSIFSYSGNRFFSKRPKAIPYRFTAAVGDPMPPDAVASPVIMNTLRALSDDCIEITASIGRDAILSHLEKIGKKPFISCKAGHLTGLNIAQCLMNDTISTDIPQLKAWLQVLLDVSKSQSKLCDYWMNAQQLERVNALQPKELMVTTVGNQEHHEAVISVLWPILTHTPVYLLSAADTVVPDHTRQFAGSMILRKQMYDIVPSKRIAFYDFSAAKDLVLPNIGWRPCFVTASGIIIAMSMKRSVFKMDDGTIQLGMRSRTRGLLLPGFYQPNLAQPNNITGPSLTIPFSLPPHLYLDEAGFLAELQ